MADAPRGAQQAHKSTLLSDTALASDIVAQGSPRTLPQPWCAHRGAATPPLELWLELSLCLQLGWPRGATWAGGGSARFGPPLTALLLDEDK